MNDRIAGVPVWAIVAGTVGIAAAFILYRRHKASTAPDRPAGNQQIAIGQPAPGQAPIPLSTGAQLPAPSGVVAMPDYQVGIPLVAVAATQPGAPAAAQTSPYANLGGPVGGPSPLDQAVFPSQLAGTVDDISSGGGIGSGTGMFPGDPQKDPGGPAPPDGGCDPSGALAADCASQSGTWNPSNCSCTPITLGDCPSGQVKCNGGCQDRGTPCAPVGGGGGSGGGCNADQAKITLCATHGGTWDQKTCSCKGADTGGNQQDCKTATDPSGKQQRVCPKFGHWVCASGKKSGHKAKAAGGDADAKTCGSWRWEPNPGAATAPGLGNAVAAPTTSLNVQPAFLSATVGGGSHPADEQQFPVNVRPGGAK